jgi:hypothetical protein
LGFAHLAGASTGADNSYKANLRITLNFLKDHQRWRATSFGTPPFALPFWPPTVKQTKAQSPDAFVGATPPAMEDREQAEAASTQDPRPVAVGLLTSNVVPILQPARSSRAPNV